MCVCVSACVLFVPRGRVAVNDECLPLVFASPSEPFEKYNTFCYIIVSSCLSYYFIQWLKSVETLVFIPSSIHNWCYI